MAQTKRSTSAGTPTVELPLLSLARQVRSWADTLLSVAGNATDMGMTLVQARVKDPRKKAAVARAGSQLRRWREAAGMTARELADAVGLGETKLIEQAEGGLATLPFDVVLRLAGVLGRRDPIPVAMALTRQYNPELWKALEAIGVGRLAIQGTRERELANVYRASDAARTLDDEGFARVLEFTKGAFDMAVAFSNEAAKAAAGSQPPAGRPARKT
jgi:transcriptional regulator with XRE-family HTH domain